MTDENRRAKCDSLQTKRAWHTATPTTISMPLLNEGTDVWRPVEATPLPSGADRIESAVSDDEEWAFAPGTVVRCEWKIFDGKCELTAVDPADWTTAFHPYQTFEVGRGLPLRRWTTVRT